MPAEKTALEIFREAAKKIVSVPRDEILKREVKYKQRRKNQRRKQGLES